MMGRRGVGMRPRLVGAKGNNFSHFSLSYACFFHYPTPVFSLSYTLKNHTKAIFICIIQRKAVTLPPKPSNRSMFFPVCSCIPQDKQHIY